MTNQANQIPLLRVIRCKAGSETYALDMANVYSIQRSDALRRNPSAGLLAGWFPFRNQNVPVFDLARMLGRELQAPHGPRVILMNPLPGVERGWGLLVDQVSEIATVDPADVLPLPGQETSMSLFCRAINDGDDLILMLEPARLAPVGSARQLEAAPTSAPAARPEGPPTKPRPLNRLHANQMILFSLSGTGGRTHFAISTIQVLEIVTPLRLLAVPGASREILGYVMWRRRAIPVIDWIVRMGLPGRVDLRRARLMIVRTGASSQMESVFGVYVDPGIRMLRLPAKYRLCDEAPSIPAAFVKGVVEIDHQVTVIPNIQEIIALDTGLTQPQAAG